MPVFNRFLNAFDREDLQKPIQPQNEITGIDSRCNESSVRPSNCHDYVQFGHGAHAGGDLVMSLTTKQDDVIQAEVAAGLPAWGRLTQSIPPELSAALALIKRQCAGANRGKDWFATALQVATSVGLTHNLLPALTGLRTELMAKVHFCNQNDQAALAQEIASQVAPLAQACDVLDAARPSIHRLALSNDGAQKLSAALDLPFVASTPDWLESTSSTDALIRLHGNLKLTSGTLMKIASDMRAGLSPAHDPTPCDALTMVCCQVMGNDVALTIGAASLQPEDSDLGPLVAQNILQSIRLMTDATTVFTEYFVRGNSMSRERISHGLANSLMLVTSRLPQTA